MSYLSVCGFEIYGTINGVCAEGPGSDIKKMKKKLRDQVGLCTQLMQLSIRNTLGSLNIWYKSLAVQSSSH